jgi:ATP phosphoribosyltransferase regulatory subunit
VRTAYGVAGRVDLDLSEISNLGYYTGISFEALVPGLGFEVANGGRYDDLVSRFGPAQPAVGVALGIDRILLACRSEQARNMPHPVSPDLLVAASDDPRCLAAVQRWRQQGLHVVVDVSGRQEEELWRFARQIGSPRALAWAGDGFDVYEGGEQAGQPARHLPLAQALDGAGD